MNTEETYGPWVDLAGGNRPVPAYTPVEVKFRSGDIGEPRLAHDYRWPHRGNPFEIMAYRIIATRPALEAAEQMLRDKGYAITPPTKPLTFEDVEPITEAPPRFTVYWVVSVVDREGVYSVPFDNGEFDNYRIKRRMAYLDKEHALIAAKHIFGLKGGEL